MAEGEGGIQLGAEWRLKPSCMRSELDSGEAYLLLCYVCRVFRQGFAVPVWTPFPTAPGESLCFGGDACAYGVGAAYRGQL